jgi:NAD(P)-dependent dehydrogenase (short-subunit alcohol dehydrogenase family)
VLVTGASSGLGRGLAINAAKQGARKVILVARSKKGLETTSQLIDEMLSTINGDHDASSSSSESGKQSKNKSKTKKCEVLMVPCDVTLYKEVSQLAERCKSGKGDIGMINLLINCAGRLYIYIYIYLYVCVCVLHGLFSRPPPLLPNHSYPPYRFMSFIPTHSTHTHDPFL